MIPDGASLMIGGFMAVGTPERLIDEIASMSDEDLMRPYRYYEFASMEDRPVVGWLVGNTFGHYDEHLPWIRAIAEG